MATNFATALQTQGAAQQQSSQQFAEMLQAQQQQMAVQANQVALMRSQMEALANGMREVLTRQATATPVDGLGSTSASSGAGPPRQHRLDIGDSETVKSIVHPGILEKCVAHNGEDATFPSWRFRIESLAALIGLDSYLESALTTDEVELRAVVLSDEDMATRAKAVWYLLVQSQSTKGINIMLCLTDPG